MSLVYRLKAWKNFRLLSLLSLLALASLPVFAQVDRTGLNGTVKDASGKVLTGAQVRLRNQSDDDNPWR